MGKRIDPGATSYTDDGLWPAGYYSYNAGDPLAAGTGELVSLAGYIQTYSNYVGVLVSGNTLVMGNGHKALFLDDGLSPGFNGGPRLINFDRILCGAGGQLIDLTSWSFAIDLKFITGGSGDDILLDSSGNTTIKAGLGNDYIWTGSGNDVADGQAGNDRIVAGTGNDRLLGSTGDDILVAGRGNNWLDGGVGFDTVDFSKLTGKINVDLRLHKAVVTDAATGAVLFTDTVLRAEKIIGTDQGMTIELWKTPGVIANGGDGDDVFKVSGVDNVLSGGLGSDTYSWTRKLVAKQAVEGDHATITDFAAGTDHLKLGDFLTGLVGKTYADVLQLEDTEAGTMVSALAGNAFRDIAFLSGVHTSDIADLGLI